jgi:hypothetical protein
MFRKRAPFTRPLAALMPALLLWAFMGCVAVCAAHAEEGRGADASAVSAEIREANCPEACPVTEAAFIVPSTRFGPNQQAVTGRPAPALAAPEAPRALSLAAHYSVPPKATDPPFERLRTLLI